MDISLISSKVKYTNNTPNLFTYVYFVNVITKHVSYTIYNTKDPFWVCKMTFVTLDILAHVNVEVTLLSTSK